MVWQWEEVCLSIFSGQIFSRVGTFLIVEQTLFLLGPGVWYVLSYDSSTRVQSVLSVSWRKQSHVSKQRETIADGAFKGV